MESSSEPAGPPTDPAAEPSGDASSSESQGQRPASESTRQTVGLVVVAVLLVWTYVYNYIAKGLGGLESFFKLLDTLSEDLVMDSLVAFVVGLAIVLVFSITKLYTHVVSNPHAFRIIELICLEELPRRSWKRLFVRLTTLPNEPEPPDVYPHRATSILLFFSGIYLLSWLYVVLFSEALFFVSWSAGVDLPISGENLQLLPTLALAIPFSARVMAYLHYPYAQDYADFMPGAAFVLLLVASLGFLFQSADQKFFLTQVWADPKFLRSFMRNGLLLAFIPVFSEGVFWLFNVYTPGAKPEEESPEGAPPEPSKPSIDGAAGS